MPAKSIWSWVWINSEVSLLTSGLNGLPINEMGYYGHPPLLLYTRGACSMKLEVQALNAYIYNHALFPMDCPFN